MLLGPLACKARSDTCWIILGMHVSSLFHAGEDAPIGVRAAHATFAFVELVPARRPSGPRVASGHRGVVAHDVGVRDLIQRGQGQGPVGHFPGEACGSYWGSSN